MSGTATSGSDGTGATVAVLGPTRIGDDDATPHQRAIIAALALAPSTGADIDVLADGIWDGRPPRSARASIQNQMTRLRRRHGADLVRYENGRYRLGWATDVWHFENDVEHARTLGHAARIPLLTTALDRWRGTPFADIDCHAAEIERANLFERQAAAAESLALARLQVGDLEACIADLQLRVEWDPYRDRFWELLVISLQRAGRRSEALRALGAHARRLADEFGAQPSARMLELAATLRTSGSVDLTRPADTHAVDGHHHGLARRHCRARPRRRVHRSG